MKRYKESDEKRKRLYLGIDIHRLRWFVTVITEEVELFSGSIPGTWDALRTLLERYRGCEIQAVYEAGYSGFWLYDRLVEYGVDCIVTPPSLVPSEYGNRVKTDRRDSRKLAQLLAKGLLRRVWVPTAEERCERQVIRRRRQLIADRVRIQNRIKGELYFYGIEVPAPVGRWSNLYVERLHRLCLENRWMRESFQRLLEEYASLTQQIGLQTDLLRELAAAPRYQEQVKILQTIPGVGSITAMELLLELQDVGRFHRANQLAAYVGLTPSQYSTAEKIRMGRITGIGKNTLRAMLVEASWRLIEKDPAMREKYERIKLRAGSKRAIVAIARMTLLRARRILLDRQPYVVGLAM